MGHTKIRIARIFAILAIGAAWLPVAWASRADKANTLTQCIAKSETILVGFVDGKEENAADGIATVRVLRVLKGSLEAKQIRIVDSSFRANFGEALEGPVAVQVKQGYVFFLKATSDGDRQLFNPYDGIVLPSGPIVAEIMDQVRPSTGTISATPPTTEPAPSFDLKRLAQEVERVVKKSYPKATCELSGNQIHFEFDARDFMVHEGLMTGEWQDARKERGPNRHGIVGDIEIVKGPFESQVKFPLSVDKRYFTLSVFAPYSKQLDAYLYVAVKYPKDVPEGFKDQLGRLLDDFESYVAKSGE